MIASGTSDPVDNLVQLGRSYASMHSRHWSPWTVEIQNDCLEQSLPFILNIIAADPSVFDDAVNDVILARALS